MFGYMIGNRLETLLKFAISSEFCFTVLHVHVHGVLTYLLT